MTDISKLKEALEEEKATLVTQLNAHGEKEPGEEVWDPSSKNTEGEEAEQIDIADQIEDLVTNAPIVETLDEHLQDVEAALQKIGEGTYGTCEVCGEEISPERLAANPAARTCMQHAK